MDFTNGLSRNFYNEITSDEFTSDSSGFDDDEEDDDDDDTLVNIDSSFDIKKSTKKKNLTSTFHEECDINDIDNRNILLKLFQRERTGFMSGGFMSKRNRTAFTKVPTRLNFCLKDIVPYCYLHTHMFMGLTACGQFLVSYNVCYDENLWAANNYNFSSYYKYTLYFWIYRPHQPLGKFYKTCLFDDHGVDNLKTVSMIQWVTNPRVLIIHGASEHENEDSYITIVRVPKLGCLDCKKLADSESSDFFRCEALCIKCNMTIHTKYSTTESDPKFNPYVNLICPERIIIVANGFIHMLHVELEIQKQQLQSVSSNQNSSHQQQIFGNSIKSGDIMNTQQKDDKNIVDTAINQYDKKRQSLLSPSLLSSHSNNGSCSSSTNNIETGYDDKNNIVARIIADFSEYEIESPQMTSNNSCNMMNDKLSSTFHTTTTDFINNKSKNYDELVFTCGLSTSDSNSNSNSITELNSNSNNNTSSKQSINNNNSNNTANHRSKVSLLNHSGSRGKRNPRIVTKSFRNGVTTIDLQNNSTSTVTGNNSTNGDNNNDKASAYEFSEDNEKCEKIGIFRKRRLADKKYEFSEDNSENIVPFHKSRILNQTQRTRLYHRTLSSSHHHHIHHHPIYVSASSSQTYETTNHHHRASPSQGFRSPCGSPVGSGRLLRSPSKANSICSSLQQQQQQQQQQVQQLPSCSYQHQQSQQQQQQQSQQMMNTVKPLNTLSPRQISTATKTHFETSFYGSNSNGNSTGSSNNGNMSPIAPFLSPRRENPFDSKVFEVPLLVNTEGQEKPTCTMKLRRCYVEEDDANSVITSEEDDCIFPGYHTSLPMEVHGSCYSDMQMISQASYQKLKCPTVLITQHSFDLETFTYYVISNLCQKNHKTYDVFYDWACEIVNVCPHSNSVICILMAHFTARDQLMNSTKCLNCSRNIDCVFHRRQFECRILFTWNMEFGDWDVLDYGNLYEVPSSINHKKTITATTTVTAATSTTKTTTPIGLNKIAKTLASELSENINKMHNFKYNLRVLNSDIDKSKDSITDLDNCIRFYRKKLKSNFNESISNE